MTRHGQHRTQEKELLQQSGELRGVRVPFDPKCLPFPR